MQFAADTTISNRSGDTAAHFAASMGREECIHLVLDYNLDLAYARNLAGATPMQAARSTGQVRLVKAIQQRLQIRSNEANPPTQIISTPVIEVANDGDQYGLQNENGGSNQLNAAGSLDNVHTVQPASSMVAVTEEVDPFEDHWDVPGPPPTHSPPNQNTDPSKENDIPKMSPKAAIREALRRRPGDRADISSDSESDDDLVATSGETANTSDSQLENVATSTMNDIVDQTAHEGSHNYDDYWQESTSGANPWYTQGQDDQQHYASNASAEYDTGETQNGGSPVWQEMYDEHHQAVYYLDTVSGHSQWEKPAGFKSEIPSQDVGVAGTAEVVQEEVVHDSYREDLSNDTWSARYNYVNEEADIYQQEAIPPPPKTPPERELSFTM